MSEFLAEAQVLVTPNTAAFAASLREQLNAAVAKAGPVVVPVLAAPSAGAAASTATFVAAQQEATAATLGLSAATGLETKALDLAVKAQLDAAAAAQLAGAAAQAEAAEIATLIAAQQAAAVAFTKTEAIALASVGSTSALAASRATLRATTVAVTANEVAFDRALATTSVALKNAAADALLEARALQASAQAAFDSAVAHRADASATAHSAAAHAQATRGLAAETLALGGLRGATLAASAPFLIGATGAIILAKSIKEASDATEEFNKTSVVFGESAEQITHFAETTATSLGISNTEALRSAAIFGNLFRSIQIAEPAAADLSESLVRLASDLASFNNADPSRVLEALRSGLVGQARPLRVFGIFLTQARAQQQALIDTGKKQITELTNAEIVQARYNIIMRDSVLAQGDFARTSDQLANQTRILKAQLSNLGEALGAVVVPAVGLTVGLLNDYISSVRRAVKGTQDFIAVLGKLPGPAGVAGGKIAGLAVQASKLYFRFALLGPVMGAATLAEKAFGDGADEASKKVTVFSDALGALADLIAALQVAGAKPLKNISSQLDALEVQRLKIETGLDAGGRAAEEANLRQQIELDKQKVDQTKSGTKARKEALEELKSDQDDLARLLEEDAQEIKAAADRQRKAAADIAKAQEDATTAFLEGFDSKRQKILNAITAASLTERLNDDIKAEVVLKQFLKNEIDAIKARIKRLNLHGAALKAARAAIAAINQEIFNVTQDIAADQKAAQERTQDILNQKLDFKIQIAQARDNVAAEIRARRAKLAQITKELVRAKKEFGKNSLAWLELKAAQAEQIAAIKELEKQNKTSGEDARKQAAAFLFSQLQAQQGFASNLLGNLIPSGQTSGLVGVPSPTTGPGKGVSLAAAVQEGKAGGGPTSGQVSSTNEILHKILQQLRVLNGDRDHPEANYEARTARARGDSTWGF